MIGPWYSLFVLESFTSWGSHPSYLLECGWGNSKEGSHGTAVFGSLTIIPSVWWSLLCFSTARVRVVSCNVAYDLCRQGYWVLLISQLLGALELFISYLVMTLDELVAGKKLIYLSRVAEIDSLPCVPISQILPNCSQFPVAIIERLRETGFLNPCCFSYSILSIHEKWEAGLYGRLI